MHTLATLPQTSVELRWDKALNGSPITRARQLRGALAQAFAGDDLFHQHDAEGKPLYRYPRIQYRWHGGNGITLGWGDAAERLLQLPWLDLDLDFGHQSVRVADALLMTNRGVFGVSEDLCRYRFCSPVLLFNQKNYRRYQAMTPEEQHLERDRLLIAQLLTAMSGLDVRFEGRLYATFASMRSQPCRYKNQDLLGLKGHFVCNAVLPTGFAVGHAVSHGFGWIMPMTHGEIL